MNIIQWEPRVRCHKVLRLYQKDAQGIRDEALIDDVGYGLLARCESIRLVTDAYRGLIRCPLCSALVLEDGQGPARDKQQLLHCRACDWQMLWGDYFRTFQGKQLRGKNFEPDLDHFIEHFPKARTPSQKMLLIDRLIHAVHKATGKPAAVNLLAGTASKLSLFLDDLAYGAGSTSGVRETKAEWDDRLRTSRWGRRFEATEDTQTRAGKGRSQCKSSRPRL